MSTGLDLGGSLIGDKRYCQCNWPSHELHITVFTRQRAEMTAWWVSPTNKKN